MLVISSLLTIVVCLPCIELYIGWDMPFVEINTNIFKVFGFIVPPEKQLGFMFGPPLVLMLTGRLLTLSFMKLVKGPAI